MTVTTVAGDWFGFELEPVATYVDSPPNPRCSTRHASVPPIPSIPPAPTPEEKSYRTQNEQGERTRLRNLGYPETDRIRVPCKVKGGAAA